MQRTQQRIKNTGQHAKKQNTAILQKNGAARKRTQQMSPYAQHIAAQRAQKSKTKLSPCSAHTTQNILYCAQIFKKCAIIRALHKFM
jgi:hypothetical protein